MRTPPTHAQLAQWRELPPACIYKHDSRSRVWTPGSGGAETAGIKTSGGVVVVFKQWVHHPLKQAVLWVLRLHPAQRERRMHRRLAAAGLPAAPIWGAGLVRRGLGVEAWLATPALGESVYNRIRLGAEGEELAARGRTLLEQLAVAGYVWRDSKASNVLCDADGRLWLIDLGSARRSVSDAQRQRMLARWDAHVAEAFSLRAEPDW